MDKDRFLASGLIEQYVLGLTSPEEDEEVERYANAFPEIKSEIETLQGAMKQYAVQSSSEPEPKMQTKPKAPTSRSFLFALAAILLTMMLAGNFYLQKVDFENRFNATSTAYATFQKQCEAEQARLTELEQIYAFINKASTRIIPLHGTKIAPNALAIAYWNESEQKAYINLMNLPPPPEGQQYQIWADIDQEMVSMGLLVFKNGKIQSINFSQNVNSLNISLEPEGGSNKPNVALIYVNGAV